jgi:hypothetical protein
VVQALPVGALEVALGQVLGLEAQEELFFGVIASGE